jgi:DNA-binding PadR family transcriptional regulator
MRRKLGELVPLEEALLKVARDFTDNGRPRFYAYELKNHVAIGVSSGGCRGAATGTLYRALARLVEWGYLVSDWEVLPPRENRPRRRYYALRQGAGQVD